MGGGGGGGGGGGVTDIAGGLAGATPFGAAAGAIGMALAGGPSSADVGDIGQDTRFGPVNVGGQFGSPATTGIGGNVVPLTILAVAIIVAVLLFRRR